MSKAPNLHKKTLAVTTAAILGFGAAGMARADAKAFSSLVIDDFIIAESPGNPLDLSDFSKLITSDTADASANLTGFPGETTSETRRASLASPAVGVADPRLACAGPDCSGISQNDFSQQPYQPLQLFARGDSLLGGSFLDLGTGTPGATASQVAEVQINQVNTNGSSDASVSNASEFRFVLSHPADLRFEFTASSDFHLLTKDLNAVAKANRHFLINIFNANTGAQVFRWVPDGKAGTISGGNEVEDSFDMNFADSLLSPGETGPIHLAGDFVAVATNLSAGQLYRLNISGAVGASASESPSTVTVPAPATLALLSAGLLGMGAASRRRCKG